MTDAHAPTAEDECACCRTTVRTDEWHPVASRTDREGTRIVPFCSEDCRERWLAERPELSAGEP